MTINVTRSSMPSYEEYCEEIKDLWDSRWLTNMGAKHVEFERRLQEYLQVPEVVLFTNGHMALEDLIASFHFPEGGEVITTPFTFVSTTHAIVRNGLRPVFCDIDPVDFTIDTSKIEALITPRTVAILPVHVYGNVCHVEEIAAIAARHRGNASVFAAEQKNGALEQESRAAEQENRTSNQWKSADEVAQSAAAEKNSTGYNGDIKVIYDAAHTFGVRRQEKSAGAGDGKKAGETCWCSAADDIKRLEKSAGEGNDQKSGEICRCSAADDIKSGGTCWRSAVDYGDAGILSFHATKVFHTIEGGAAICHDAAQREVLDDLKNFGIRNPESCMYIGGNAKMSEFQAAMGLCNLRHIDEEIAKRARVYERYASQLGDLEELGLIRLWRPQPDVRPNYAYLPVVFEGRAEDESQQADGQQVEKRQADRQQVDGQQLGSQQPERQLPDSFLRDRVWEALKAEGIVARKYFYPLTSDYECYREGQQISGHDTPVARRIASQILTLPMYADLAMPDVDRICRIVRETVIRASSGR